MPTLETDPGCQLIVALSDQDVLVDESVVDQIAGEVHAFKFGNELSATTANDVISTTRGKDPSALIYLDHKPGEEVPHALERLIARDAAFLPDMYSIMASVGQKALSRAIETFPSIEFVAHTLSSTTSDHDAKALYESDATTQVLRFARVAAAAGIRIVSCSGCDVATLRADSGTRDLKIIATGIRLPDEELYGQERYLTPRQACEDGADWLVVGTTIINAKDRLAQVRLIKADLAPKTVAGR